MRKESLGAYFSDFWNIIDCALFLTYLTYYIIRGIDTNSVIPEYAGEQKLDPTKLVPWVFLNTFMILLATMKMLFFARVTQSVGQLVKLVSQTMYDVRVFLGFYIVWCCIFSLLFFVGGFSFPDKQYPHVSNTLVTFLSVFRNSIGDIKAPEYDYWTDPKTVTANHTKNYLLHESMAGYAWMLLALNQIFMMIILLNFLIAIISQSYDMVISQATVSEYQDKLAFNNEIMGVKDQVAHQFGTVEKGNIFLLSSSIQSDEITNPYEGFVKTIKTGTQVEVNRLHEAMIQKFDTLMEMIDQAKMPKKKDETKNADGKKDDGDKKAEKDDEEDKTLEEQVADLKEEMSEMKKELLEAIQNKN